MERPPLNALQVFVTAARAKNMTRAAERLHLTVSALSHQVRTLEQRLGYTLFKRGPRGLALTPEGTLLLDRVGPHLDAIDGALRPLRTRRDNALSLSAMPSLASSWLMPRLPRFVAKHPDVEINLDSSIDLVDFADGRFDAAMRYGPGQWDGVVSELLFEEWLTPVASPSLIAGRKRPKLDELAAWPLLCPEDPWPQWFEKFGGTPPTRYAASFSDSETRQRAAVEGVGIALGRMAMVRPLIESGMLIALFPERLRARYARETAAELRGARAARVALARAMSGMAAGLRKAGSVDNPEPAHECLDIITGARHARRFFGFPDPRAALPV
jgi:LysR family transcriptional regulator, glycine cleavage system transcriptional activator